MEVFLGGAIGGAVTLVAVYITIEGTRKENIELKNERNRSFLDTFLIKSSNGMLDDFKEEYQVQDVKVIIDDNYETLIRNDTTLIRQKGGVKFIGITNCGPALIKDIKVNIKNKNNTVKENFVSRILVNELFFIPIVFEKSHEIDTPIDTIEITYKTLVDEIIIVNKKFYDENTYNEEINITKNYNYGYKKTKCKFTKLKTF
ncbi:hypothetical protein [Clostridium novyi]|uniref:hypothetical protein n=1 Tax=Clostridium novyi TaxID=1542 RepID=UPI0004D3B377|nr:hypothetical protein [Clostridium novyi]KEH95896.1 hypothetical protein Z964_00720 [Clostridium novyi A str. GD211209]